jgi:hypothetical protein
MLVRVPLECRCAETAETSRRGKKLINKVVTEMRCGIVRNVDMTHADLI